MGSVIQRAREVVNVDDMDLVLSAAGIWCPSVQGPGGSVLRDQSGKQNHGTTSTISWDSSKQAYSFDGTGYVDVPSSPSINITGNKLSIGGWIYWTAESGTSDTPLGRWGSTESMDYLLIIQNGSNKLQFYVNGGAASVTSSSTIPKNQWVHIAGVYDGATLQIYINGKPNGSSAAYTSSLNDSTGKFAIGATYDNAAGDDFFNGLIDDIRIFPHALKPQQIKRLYSGGQGRGIGLRPSRYVYEPIRTNYDADLVQSAAGIWCPSVQGPGGLILRDLSENSNDGTLTNMDPATDWVDRALDFDGGNDHVDAGTAFANFAVTDSFSVSAWIYVRSIVSNSGIVTRYASASESGWQMRLLSTGKVRFGIVNHAGAYRLSDTAVLSTGKWYHVVGVRVGGGNSYTYLDGEYSSTTVNGGTPTAIQGTYNFRIADLLNVYFNGLIDDVRIYPHALKPQQIKRLYSGGQGRGIGLGPDSLVSPYTTQWGSVAAAASSFQAAWGASATTIAGVASGQ
jgi:hypothetical protein